MEINVSLLLKADRVSDYIPGISTITNLVDLFQKCAVLPFKQKTNVSKSHYYTYLKQKSFSRCIVLLLPVVGNIIVATYDFAKRRPNYADATLVAAQTVPLSTSKTSQGESSPDPTTEGRVTDIGRQQSGYAKSWLMGKREVRVSNTVLQGSSQAIAMPGCSEEIARQLPTGVCRKKSQISSLSEQWLPGMSGCCKHSFKEPFIALYPDLPTKSGLASPQAIVENPQLSQNAQMNVQSFAIVHYHGAPTPRLSGAELSKRLRDLLQLKCSCCIKDLIAQGHKFLKEENEEALLHGVFYLATAYELYCNLDIQEYSFDWHALNQYLDKLENSLKDKETLLHYFAARENLSIFIYLFAERQNIKTHLDVLAGMTVKETPLHVAIKRGSISIAQFLLEHGADVKKHDSLQNNALHHACRSQKEGIGFVCSLLQYDPAFIRAKNSDGQTPLHLAAFTGKEKSFEYLLNQTKGRLQLDQQDREGNTLLHLAIMGWSASSAKVTGFFCKIVEALIKKGANLNILNHKKKTALDLAFENAAIIQALVQANLSPQVLVSFLQNCYLSQKNVSIFRIMAQQEWELKVPLEEIYVRLAIIENKERKTRDQALNKHSEHLQDARIPTYETIFEPKEKVEIEKLFEHKSFEKKDRKRVFIQGAAGIGKSTLCHYISYHWAKGTLWTGMFTCLFRIPLRNFTIEKYPPDKEYTPADLIAREYAGKIDRRVIEACIHDAAFREKTLLVLDGYDELPAKAQANTSLATAFKQLKELFPHILITSRPGSCSFERSCELELLGFDKEGVKHYIDRFFKHVQAEEKKQKLNHLLKTSPQVLSLAQIPINLTLLCCLFHEDPRAFDTEQSITMTAIYEKIVNWMYQWFLLRRIDQGKSGQTKEQILAEKNLRQNPEVANIAAAFEEMADFAMKNDTLYLSKREIEDFRGNKISSNELADCGLMRIPGAEIEAEEKGYFIHLTFQEFLTASKVANQYLEGERQTCQAFVQNYKFEPRYALILRMIAGSLSLAASNSRRYADVLQPFFDDLFAAPRDLAVSGELALIAECFEECQDPTVVKQYNGFIGLVKGYIKHLCLLNLNFERLLRNTNFLNHPEIIHTIRELLSDPNTKKNMLIILLRISKTGISLASEIVGLIIEELTDPTEYSGARICTDSILEKIAEQGGTLSKGALAAPIDVLKEDDRETKHYASRILTVIAKQRGELSKEALAALIQAFKKGDEETKCYAADALGEIAKQEGELSEEALVVLIQAFKEGDRATKYYAGRAIEAIAKQGGELSEETLVVLIQAFKESDRETKYSAADALRALAKQGGKLSKEALAVLIQALKKGDEETKCYVADALGEIAKQENGLQKEALAALIRALKEGDRGTKYYAGRALEAIARQGGKLPKEALAALIRALKESEERTKTHAACALKAIAKQEGELPKEALAALILALQVDPIKVKIPAAGALRAMAKQGGELQKEALAALIRVLKEGDRETKYYAAGILRKIAEQGDELPKEVLAALIQALQIDHIKVKISAAGALRATAEQGGELQKEALAALIRAFKEGDRETKYCAVVALEEIANQGGELQKEVLVVLVQALKEEDDEAQYRAVAALGEIINQGGKLPKEALVAFIQALKEAHSSTKAYVAKILGELAKQGDELPEGALDALFQTLKEGDFKLKSYAAVALVAIVKQREELPKEVLDALIQALKEGDRETKYSASRALEAIARQGGEFSKEALDTLTQALKEGDRETKYSASRALEAIARQRGELPKEALDALLQARKEGDGETKYSAVDALRKIARQGGGFSKETIDTLTQVLKEDDRETKYSAVIALKTIARQGGELSKEAIDTLIQVLKEGDRETKIHAVDTLKEVDKVALLKMSSQAFALIAEACFFIEYNFSVKGQQLQVSDKRATCLSEHALTLTYEEIRKQLSPQLAIWRKRLDSLSPAEIS
ncbi:HEAT repeat domain-containing protein [Parachlamydia sp. AcF125]|uniref:HEAT repeat domain-containing protein n=1 Tax=Parachlamydia sp. AcF125 TaxID=2795736 RepID=UPI001BC9D270|nr:HEAT repeat domain-containing protein [Parachlamydia sp. AcF125]MBS4168593.1 Phosphocholine transferase AnkX [Parachlamydia sp. AcF125]